ncbi:hypothetical protein Q5424_20100 [Conexibacter sp. JD483]|uniref:hypothetical protein n=1 Tax=unclassified Conexibacter TaxID=2627773 RepID=UPI002717400A|nr:MULTISPECIES: hypothetical protein [unclassified Conexibacter]MDO8188955.1 hypothetical protein [Conexibacter sp. CPCC 205706]MDO8201730.1 hypothetical protein [Conexibacter sp. CPCC 205762]MDR9371413.1 hypothetical protein [Conexibacter sp. JD483]
MRLLIRPLLAAVAIALLAAAATSARSEAATSKIVYACRPQLCVVDPATGISSPLTTDGSDDSPYYDPSLSADGTRMAARRHNDVLVGAASGNLAESWGGAPQGTNDVALSPDGSAVAESHTYVQNVNRLVCSPFSGCSLQLVLQDMSGTTWSRGVAGRGPTRGFSGGGGVGFLGTGQLLISYYTISEDAHKVCVVATPETPADPPCGATAREVGATLSWPEGSRDGKLIAAAKGPARGGGPSSVALYDAASGAFLRTVATGTAPAFSPDGATIAYQSADGWIELVPTAGGAARRLVRGTMPTWSAGSGPGPRLSAARLGVARGRVAVPLRCDGRAACAGRLRVTKGRVTVASGSYRVAGGRSAKIALKLSKRGQALLARKRSQQVAVTLTPRGARAVTAKATLRR